MSLIIYTSQACQAISRIKLSSNKYIKPGRSSPLVKDVGTIPLGDATRKIPQNLGGANGNFLGQMPPYISSNDSNTTPDKPKGMASSYPSGINGIAEAGKVACRQSNGQAPIHNHSHPNVTDGLYNQSTHASTVNGFQKHFPDDIDDDDILGVSYDSFSKLRRAKWLTYSINASVDNTYHPVVTSVVQ